MSAVLSVPLHPLAVVLGVSWYGAADVEVGGVTIVEPEDVPAGLDGTLVLAVGARGAEAVALVKAAGAAGAAAVALRARGGLSEPLRAAARSADVAVLGVPSGVRWDELESGVRDALHARRAALPREARDGLRSLARTVATMTGASSSIGTTIDKRIRGLSRNGRASSLTALPRHRQ